jgi:hypothetical protein
LSEIKWDGLIHEDGKLIDPLTLHQVKSVAQQFDDVSDVQVGKEAIMSMSNDDRYFESSF